MRSRPMIGRGRALKTTRDLSEATQGELAGERARRITELRRRRQQRPRSASSRLLFSLGASHFLRRFLRFVDCSAAKKAKERARAILEYLIMKIDLQ